jgi:small-conductance mechanosensitive channel
VDHVERVSGAQALLRRRILLRFRKEGIAMPFPTTTVNLKREE